MNNPDTGALLPVTPEDRNLFKLIITGMVGPTKHNAIDGGGFDTDERMQAIARHRHQSETGAALTGDGRDAGGVSEKAVMVCPQCEGEGGYPDGLDDAACHTDCTRCAGNGWIVDLAALAQPVEAGEDG